MAREKDIQKRAATIQQYFNKIGITKIGDLTTDEEVNDIYAGFGGYKTSFEGFTSVDQSRIQRYREYEQMTYVPELNAGLELYADDATLYNEDDQVIATEADNNDVAETVENLWYRSLDMNANLWHIVYNTCKYGEGFYELIPDSYEKPQRVKHMRFIPPQFVTREERDGNLIAFVVKIPPSEGEGQGYSPAGAYTQNTPGFDMSGEGEEIVLKPWQIVHFKLDDKEFEPYGKSILESGRLSFKQMKLIEDAMLIYRISRAPERRVFRIPVGNLPYRDAMNRVEDFKQKYRKTPWIDAACTSLDTEIPLLNGEVKSLRELIEDYDSGKKNWVYSIDRDNKNQIVPGEILWAGVTRKNTKVLKITLDDGQTFKFTPDHKFLMRDGSYKEAQYLEEGDSIMPLYSKKTKKGYRSVYNPKSSKYYPRYMMSARYTSDNLWNSDWGKRVVHHIDFDKENDYPENLKLMESKEHASYHAKLNHQLWQDPKFRSKINKAIKRKWQDPNFREMMSKNTSKRSKENWQDPEYREYMSNAISEGLKKYYEENPEKANEWYEFIKQFDTLENRKKNADSIRETYKNKEYSEKEREYFRQKSKEYWENNPERKEEYSERMSSIGKQYGHIGARLKNKFYSLDLEIDYQTWKESLNEEEYNNIINGIQFDDIIDRAIHFNTKKQVAKYLDCNPGVISNKLYENGYSNWEEFYRDVNGLENKEDYIRSAVGSSNNPKELKTIIGCSLPTAYKYFKQYKNEPVNHKIVSIEEDEETIDTGTLTINHYHNFAIGNQDSGIFVKNSGEINYKANPLCLTFDTKIDLLDGRSETLETLIKEYNEGKENWTYSIDRENGNQVVPGKIEWAGPTRKNATLVEVYIDNGKSVRCTPDHKFLLRNGEYKEAQYLQAGDSLMPKYTKLKKAGTKSKKPYCQIYDPSENKYKFLHSIVAKSVNPAEWNKPWKFRIVHHKDFNKFNNDPSNLVIMERHDHNKYHLDLMNKLWSNDEYKEMQIKARKKAWANTSEERRQLQSDLMAQYNKSDQHRKTTIERNKKFWSDPLLKKKTSRKMRKPKSTTDNMKIHFDEKFWSFIKEGCQKNNTQTQLVEWLNNNQDFIKHFSTLTPRNIHTIHRHLLQKAFQQKGYNSFDEYYYDVTDDKKLIYEDIEGYIEQGYSQKKIGNIFGVSRSKVRNLQRQNHKVTKVVWLDGREDTGCITVGKYHNFSILDSIYIKNSLNDDFFLPTRPDGTGVQIDTLPGGQQLGEIDDVRYFKEKILRTMRIPLAYLTGEMSGDVAKTSLAAMDVRFAKTIERIQKMIVKGLEKIAIIELAFKRYSIEDLYSFQITLTTPSKIYEMQELEVLTQKLTVIQTALGMADENGVLYLPREWLYRNISKFNDQEISNIKLMQQAELAEKQEVQQRAEAGTAGAEVAGGGAEPVGGGLEAPELGGEEAPEELPGGEEGGEEEVAPAVEPEAGGGEAGLEVASKILSIAGKDFLLENENDLREVINFVKHERENAKITKDKSEKKRKRKLFENSFNVLFMKGELKGLIKRKSNGNNMLKD